MTARDELRELVFPVLEKCFDSDWNMTYAEMVADTTIEAGWRPPARTITTEAELDALPEGTIVQAGYRYYWLEASRHDVAWWVIFNEQHYFRSADLELPATVVHEPKG